MVGASTMQDFHEGWTPTGLTILVCIGISLSNALELLLLIVTTFHHWTGLYFWSLLITTLSVIPYSVGYVITYFRVQPMLLGDIMNNVGWAVLITGQSIVLYSRLGIIYQNPRVLRLVLRMILVDGFLFYTITTVIHYGSYSNKGSFGQAGYIMEKVQMMGFSLQEMVISGIYLREIIRYQKVVGPSQENARRTIWELFGINVILIAMDISLLALVFLDFHALEKAWKALSYSYKLKLEFAILGKLVHMARAGRMSQATNDASDRWSSEFTFRSRSKSDVTTTSFL